MTLGLAHRGPAGKTSPEELIAAAHASCFSMAFSNILAKAGTPPEQLKTSATVTFVPGTGITKSVLEVEGSVPGLDEEGFRAAAEDAKENCPVSQALKNNVELTIERAPRRLSGPLALAVALGGEPLVEEAGDQQHAADGEERERAR